MKIEATSIEELIQNSGYIAIMQKLDNFMQQEFTSLERHLFAGKSITMIGYGLLTYQAKNNEEQFWPLISIAPQKNYVSIFIAGMKDDKPILEFYNHNFPKSMCGKNCLRISKISQIDFHIIKQIIDDAVIWHQNNINHYGRNCATLVD